MEKKTTQTRGVWRDQAAFERLTSEYKIPPEVMLKGMDAVVQWVNEAKGPIKTLAFGAALLALFAPIDKPLVGKPGIAGDARLRYPDSIFARMTDIFGDGYREFHGSVVSETIDVVTASNATRRTVPADLIESIIRIDRSSHLLTYLDGSGLTCTIATDPVLFKTHRFRSVLVNAESEVHKFRAAKIKSIVAEPAHSNAPALTSESALLRSKGERDA